MRSILTLIALACMPAICQPAFCQNAGQKLNDNLRQRLSDILNPQAQASSNAVAPHPLRVIAGTLAPQLCSIPLLNVTAPGKPVPMPTLKPRALPPPVRGAPNMPATPQPLDRMSIVGPAPACPAPAPSTKP